MTLESPWHLPWIAFDTETTGLSWTQGARLIEIAAVRFNPLDGQVDSTFQTLIDPGVPIRNAYIHGITTGMVKGAPRLPEAMRGFLDFLGEPTDVILCAHNASFDLGFLRGAAALHALDPGGYIVVDSLTWARRCLASKNHKLTTLVEHLDLPRAQFHRALADSHAVAGVVTHLAREHRAKYQHRKDAKHRWGGEEVVTMPRRATVVPGQPIPPPAWLFRR